MSRKNLLTIGDLSRISGVGRETIRFYERKGLLKEPARDVNGYRLYSTEARRRLSFIIRAKELGFSLTEVSELLSLRADPVSNCAQMKKRVEVKIAEVKSKIESLENIERILVNLKQNCLGDSVPLGDCPILESLEEERDED